MVLVVGLDYKMMVNGCDKMNCYTSLGGSGRSSVCPLSVAVGSDTWKIRLDDEGVVREE